jgi:hypothetical protein
MEEIDGIAVDLTLLPSQLHDVAPLIRRFAVGDDLVRSERIESTPEVELEGLAGLSSAQWDALDAFLDEHMDAVRDHRSRMSREWVCNGGVGSPAR